MARIDQVGGFISAENWKIPGGFQLGFNNNIILYRLNSMFIL